MPRTWATPCPTETTRPTSRAVNSARPAATTSPRTVSVWRMESRNGSCGRRGSACLLKLCMLSVALIQGLEETGFQALQIRIQVPYEAVRMGPQLNAAEQLRTGGETHLEAVVQFMSQEKGQALARLLGNREGRADFHLAVRVPRRLDDRVPLCRVERSQPLHDDLQDLLLQIRVGE